MGITDLVDKVKKAIDKKTGQYSEDAAKRLKEIIEEGFQNEGYPTHKWKPLSDITIRIEKKKGYPQPNKILTATGKMRKSVKIEEMGDKTYKVTVEDDKAVLHEYGTTDMPARPIMRPAVQQLKREKPDVDAVQVDGTSEVIK